MDSNVSALYLMIKKKMTICVFHLVVDLAQICCCCCFTDVSFP